MKILLLFKVFFFIFLFKVIEWYRIMVNYWFFEDVFNQIVIDYIGINNGKIKGNYYVILGIVGFVFVLFGNNFFVDFGVLLSMCFKEFLICQIGFIIVFWIKILEI